MKTVNEIDIYEVDGSETAFKDRQKLHISNHWNMGSMVVLWIDSVKYTVYAPDLERAIKNSTR